MIKLRKFLICIFLCSYLVSCSTTSSDEQITNSSNGEASESIHQSTEDSNNLVVHNELSASYEKLKESCEVVDYVDPYIGTPDYSHTTVTYNKEINVLDYELDPEYTDATELAAGGSYSDPAGNAIEYNRVKSITLKTTGKNDSISIYDYDHFFSVDGDGIEKVSYDSENGFTIYGKEINFDIWISSDILCGDQHVLTSIEGSGKDMINIRPKNDNYLISSPEEIKIDSSYAHIGINDIENQYIEKKTKQTLVNDVNYSKNVFLVVWRDENNKIIHYGAGCKGSAVVIPDEKLKNKKWYTSGVFQDENTYWDFAKYGLSRNIVLYPED